MTKENEISPAPAAPPIQKAERGVLCARCDHLNRGGATVCERCKSELFIKCAYCGEMNLRALENCGKCKHHLHRGIFRRHSGSHHHSLRGLRRRVAVACFWIVALGAIYLLLRLIHLF